MCCVGMHGVSAGGHDCETKPSSGEPPSRISAGHRRFGLVELRGFEPRTFSLRTRRATNCATAPWCGPHDNTRRHRVPTTSDGAVGVSPPTLRGMARSVTPPTPPSRQSFVPPLVRAASEWTWRLLLIGAGLIALFFLLGYFSQIVVPLAI